MSEQKPSLGRVVLYCLSEPHALRYAVGDEVPADIIRVYSDRLVLLLKMENQQKLFAEVSHTPSVEPEPGNWRWPPRV